jgi:hypothetical protein
MPWHPAHFIVTIWAPADGFPENPMPVDETAGGVGAGPAGIAVGTTPNETDGTDATEGTDPIVATDDTMLKGWLFLKSGVAAPDGIFQRPGVVALEGAFHGFPVFQGSAANSVATVNSNRMAAIAIERVF